MLMLKLIFAIPMSEKYINLPYVNSRTTVTKYGKLKKYAAYLIGQDVMGLIFLSSLSSYF